MPGKYRYKNFDLRLARVGDDLLEVEVLSSPAGEGVGTARIPAYTTSNLESNDQITSLSQIGDTIGQALLPGDVRLRFEASLLAAKEAGAGLRLRLRFHDQELAAIPWEAARVDEEYLALRPATPLVRYVRADEPPDSLTISGPVHVLALVSSPAGQIPLAVDEEQARLQQALASLARMNNWPRIARGCCNCSRHWRLKRREMRCSRL